MGLVLEKFKKKSDEEPPTPIPPLPYTPLYLLNTPPQEISTSLSNIIFKTKNIFVAYDKSKVIESGTTGSVCRAIHKETTTIRALKEVKIKDNPKLLSEAKREIACLKNLEHPNIERIFEYSEKDNDTIYIAIELITGKELFSKLASSYFKEPEAAVIMQQLFSAIKLTHDSGIIHRDIKAENILIQDEKTLFIKLIDYGSVEILKKFDQKATQKVGTPSYIPPEILNGEEYDFSCDMWSLGVLMYFLLCGKKPFTGASEEEIYKNIKNQSLEFKEKVWEKISNDAKELIKCLLVKNKKKRININQALSSNWIKNNICKTEDNTVLHNKDFPKSVIENVKKFKNLNQIQLLALFYFVHYLVDFNASEEIKNITKEFMYYDKDNDGKLSEDELSNFLLEGGVAKEELNLILGGIWNLLGDYRGKFVFYESFIVLCFNNRKSLFTDKNVQKLFTKLDTNGKLKLELEDLKIIYEGVEELDKKNINPVVWENFYKKMQLSNGEPITFEMFKNYMTDIDI